MDAEIDIAPELVSRLIAAQHPHLAGKVSLLAHGWDNDVFRLGDQLLVRMPRRELAVPLLEHEQRWLPVLAERLPVPIPSPVAIGRPGEGFPWPWTVFPYLDGVNAATVPRAERGSLTEPLARAVVALHAPAPADAPRNPVRGIPLAHRDAAVRERLGSARITGRARLVELWEDALAAPEFEGEPVWLHGDLHPANALVGADGGLAGLIDFGDVTSGDPATDLAAAWLFFDADARARFRSLVDADDATWGRARGWAVLMGSAMVVGSAPDSPMVPLGREVLADLAAAG